MRKSVYRSFFAQCKSILKLKYFCNKVGISPSNLTQFIKGYDNALTESNLSRLYNCIIAELEKIV